MTIWKYPLQLTDRQSFRMPIGALILSLQVQYEIPCLWALVDPKERTEERAFRIYGTGHPVDEIGRFLGTFQIHNGALVFHVFDVGVTREWDGIKREGK